MRDRFFLLPSAVEALAQGDQFRRHSVFVGGFPCQDLSIAGKQAGRKGARSGLYRQYLAVICAERPAWIVTENVGHTWRKWVPHLRRSLHRLGYASLPLRVRASDVGAPHQRTRIYLVANPNGEFLRELSRWWVRQGRQMADEFAHDGSTEQVADSAGDGRMQEHSECGGGCEGSSSERHYWNGPIRGCGWWALEPGVGRVANGVPNQVDRLTALGNAIVPPIAEIIATGIRSITG